MLTECKGDSGLTVAELEKAITRLEARSDVTSKAQCRLLKTILRLRATSGRA
jgi:hypothetical protein